MGTFHSRWFKWLSDAARATLLDEETGQSQRANQSPADCQCLTAGTTVMVAWASQTGVAEALAKQVVERLRTADVAVRSVGFDALRLTQLMQAQAVLFVVSTTCDGDPPDMAETFSRDLMAQRADLSGLRYGLLALGDRCYDDFCGFGHQLQAWLQSSGAHACFKPIEVDDEDEEAIAWWWEQIGALLPAAAHAHSQSAASAG